MTPRKGTGVRKTIQELREARGESRSDLADALDVTLDELTDWELGTAAPGVERMRLLTEHFGIRDDQINLEPNRAPTLGEQLRDALTE
jgi:transcriptional regulator with XRE-family HTH domain